MSGDTTDDDPWPNEPDDPGNAAEMEDSAVPDEQELLDDLGPDTPAVEIPEPPDPSEADVSADLVRTFWRLVIIFNIAVFALGVGPMLVFFWGEWERGGLVFVLGLATFVYGYASYKRATSRDFGSDDDHSD